VSFAHELGRQARSRAWQASCLRERVINKLEYELTIPIKQNPCLSLVFIRFNLNMDFIRENAKAISQSQFEA
jgi:hypothetical protein